MTTAGPNSPGTLANDSGVGSGAWSTPSNASASDNTRTSQTNNGQSNGLKATNFGFSIPVGATIDGIVAEIEHSANSSASGGAGNRIMDQTVRLVKGGSQAGSDYAKTGTINRWPVTASEAYATYGGATDLWGTTWTVSDINASNFGIEMTCVGNNQDGSEIGYVDHIRITIYYTVAASGGPGPHHIRRAMSGGMMVMGGGLC